MQIRRLALAPLVLTGVLSLAACGSDDEESGTTSVDADLTVVAVEGLRWSQDSYEAPAGQVDIALKNSSSQPHTLAVIAADGTQSPTILEASRDGDVESGSYDLAAGTYTIICTVPGHGNMKADLVMK
jgi:plastocyanin